MSDLSLVLCSFSLVEIVAFYRFCNFVAKVQRIFETTKLFRDYFSKIRKFLCFWYIFNRKATNRPQNSCIGIFLTIAQRAVISQGRAATSLHFISKQTSAALANLSLVFLVLVYGTLSSILYRNYSSIHLFK